MPRIAFLLLALPILAFGKDSWSSAVIKVVNTDEWCARPGIADWPAICGPPRSDAMALFNENTGSVPHPATPYSQILEIDAPDVIYIVKRTSLDGGLSFRPGAAAQFAVDGKHLLIKFDRQIVDRHGESQIHHEHDRTDILETRKRSSP